MTAAVELGREVLAVPEPDAAQRARVLEFAGLACWRSGTNMQEAQQDCEEALAIHRKVGNRRSEGMVLSGLGYVNLQQGRLEESRRCCGEGLAIHREVGNRRDEGCVLGSLGLLEAREGRFDASRRSLAEGEALLRAVDDPLGLGKLLCHRSECERLAGDLAAARTALAEAETLASAVGAGPDSELGRLLERLRASLPDGAAG